MMSRLNDFIKRMNSYGASRKPFLFLIDYEMKEPEIFLLEDIRPDQILYDINGKNNVPAGNIQALPTELNKTPVGFADYRAAFDKVQYHLKRGDTYLLNLTFETNVECSLSLKEIFQVSKARYKLWFKDRFVVFSPEIFVRIEKGKIFSYPMKGTIDADRKNAEKEILSDKKESAEHATIVDLIRNDLSLVADNVRVEKYRYIDKIITNGKNLLQVSTEISGQLKAGYHSRLGEIITGMLPAGSICGAPKAKTLEIIHEAENYDRGFYTGIVGLFDGEILDSGVMIRFIEKRNGNHFYKSGGGITFQSNALSEYNELIDKIYIPV